MAIPNWVTLSQNQGGTGTTIVSITAQTYSELVQRVGALTVNTDNAGLSATVSLLQEAREVVNVSVSPSEITIPATGGTYVFNVVSNGDWTITSYPEWCTLSTTAGTGNLSVTITAPANYSLEELTSSIVVQTVDNTASIVVTQNKVFPELSVSPSSITANTTGGTDYLNINSNTYWTITAPDWVILSEYSGQGDTIITVEIIGDTSGDGRNGEIVVTNGVETKTVDVIQYKDFSKVYFTIEALEDNTLFTLLNSSGQTISNLYYLYNNSEWTVYQGETITLSKGEIIRLKGTNNSYEGYYCGCSGGNYKIYGNIMSLIYGDNFVNTITLPKSYTFSKFFNNFTGLTDASNLILPATKLTSFSYQKMFQGCTSLSTAPSILPATALTNACYYEMFADCTSLVNTPKLPATKITGFSYYGMFSGCTSLVNAPELPATRMGTGASYDEHYCYAYMFKGCASLVTAPELPATTLTNSCYYEMFRDCTSLSTAPELPATSLEPVCYGRMFYGCTSLITAPELPATTLATNCYSSMFNGCTNLNYIKCLATNPSTGITPTFGGWVDGVASTGTFVKKTGVSWPTGISGIPEGWTVETV